MTINGTEISSLFLHKTGLIIDDRMHDDPGQHKSKDRILKIKADFEKRGMCFVTFNDIPDKRTWSSLSNISFAILDWDLDETYRELSDEFRNPEGRLSDTEEHLISFIDYLIKTFLTPIFVFTHQSPDYVKNKLQESELTKEAFNKGQIKVCAKNYIREKTIDKVLEAWCRDNPSIYVMKELEASIERARISLTQDLSRSSQFWPSLVVSAIEKDGTSEIDQEFTDFILSSLNARIVSPHYEETIIKREKQKAIDRDAIRIYSGSKFITYNQQPLDVYAGDLYESEDGKEIWINITPECSIRDKKYLFLKGHPTCRYEHIEKFGLIQKATTHCIPMLRDNVMVEFCFKSYTIFEDLNDPKQFQMKKDGKIFSRKGRLLHPYITEIQERFGHYICRHGNIRHPDTILKKYRKGKRH